MKPKSIQSALSFIACGILLVMTSCNSSGGNYEKGKLVSPDELSTLEADKANKGVRFSIVGYPAVNGDIATGANKTPVLRVNTEPNGAGTMIISFALDMGKGRNKFYVPEEFTMKDIQVFDNEGKSHSSDEKMQFSFTLNLQTDQERIHRTDIKIVDGRLQSNEKLVYLARLEDIRIDKASN
jgi:hypothetical protein